MLIMSRLTHPVLYPLSSLSLVKLLVTPLFFFISPDFFLPLLSTPYCPFPVAWIVQERHKYKDLTIWSIYDLEHVIFVSLGLGYFTQYNVFHIHLLTCKSHFMQVPHFHALSLDGHIGYFHVLAVMNRLNICVHVSLTQSFRGTYIQSLAIWKM